MTPGSRVEIIGISGSFVLHFSNGPAQGADNVELDNRLRWTSLRCSLSQSMVWEAQEKKNAFPMYICIIEQQELRYNLITVLGD